MKKVVAICLLTAFLSVLLPHQDASAGIDRKGLILWLRADEGVRTDTAGKVSAWEDQSDEGNIALQKDPAKRPSVLPAEEFVKRNPVISFDGRDDSLVLKNKVPLSGSFTAFFVARNSNQTSTRALQKIILAGKQAYVKDSRSFAFGYSCSNNMFSVTTCGGKKEVRLEHLALIERHEMIGIIKDGEKVKIYKNGRLKKKGKLTGGLNPAPEYYIIGDNPEVPGSSHKGQIAEIILYSRVLSKQERLDVEDYLKEKYWHYERKIPQPVNVDSQKNTISLQQVDTLERIFPDRIPPTVSSAKPISVPRNATACLQFSALANKDTVCSFNVSKIRRINDGHNFEGTIELNQVKPVHVEWNTQGWDYLPNGKTPAGWDKYFVRKAQFDVAEAIWKTSSIEMKKGLVYAILAEINIPEDVSPGVYQAKIIASTPEGKTEIPFSFKVHKTILPNKYALDSTHWLNFVPEYLCNKDIPEYWSERHWKLIERAGSVLKKFGDNTVYTFAMAKDSYSKGSRPLIRITFTKEGKYRFDYKNFDRWVKLFLNLGYKHIGGDHLVRTRSFTPVFDETKNKYIRLYNLFEGNSKSKEQQWFQFLEIFLTNLYQHLSENNWTKYYIQYNYDEPQNHELYKTLSQIAHKCLPGIPVVDAINNNPKRYSNNVDILVFNLRGIMANEKLAEQRKASGKINWLYHCVSPYPPYPNRGLDRRLSESRLWPWLCYRYKADGFLFWAANCYRQGTDEYEVSGAAPGDSWFLYRSPDGLCPSMRLAAFREGMIDATLLKMLSRRNPKLVDKMMKKIVNGVIEDVKPLPADWIQWYQFTGRVKYSRNTYAISPKIYHAVRASLLNELDKFSCCNRIFRNKALSLKGFQN